METLIAQLASFLLYPKASKLLEASETLPEQADPKETPNPARVKDFLKGMFYSGTYVCFILLFKKTLSVSPSQTLFFRLGTVVQC